MPRPHLTRRGVLMAGGAACAVAAGAVPAWYLLSDPRAAIRRMIETHMRGTMIEPGVVDAFVRDFLGHRPLSAHGVAIGEVCEGLGLGDLARCANNADYLRRTEEHVIDRFLRSTDLFAPDRRVDTALRYVGFWDPYSDSCRNPFADLTPPAG